MKYFLRNMMESDYDQIIPVLNAWWAGRDVVPSLPRLFFIHFRDTSYVMEFNGKAVAFLSGFPSPAYPAQAYIHFVGVHPQHRRTGLAKQLYKAFFDMARQKGCREVRCVATPINRDSIAFHKKMGFVIQPGDRMEAGIAVATAYHGPGRDRVLFAKML